MGRPAKASVPAIIYRSIRDARRWRADTHWYGATALAVGATLGAVIGAITFREVGLAALAGFVGAAGGPLVMWCMSVGYKWKRPERRFKIATLHEERTHPTHAHGLTRALEREFLGEPWWQVEYPDGSNGEWFTRPEQRQATPQEKAWNIPFDFPHLDQEGDFKIHFRGIVRAGDAPVPLDTWHWRRSASEGWTPLR